MIAHPEIAQVYQQLKLKLAQEYGTDREAYTNAKNKFINKVLQKNLVAKNRKGDSNLLFDTLIATLNSLIHLAIPIDAFPSLLSH